MQARYPKTQWTRNPGAEGKTRWTFSEHWAEFMAKGCLEYGHLSLWAFTVSGWKKRWNCLKGFMINWQLTVFAVLRSLGQNFNFALVVIQQKMPQIILSPSSSQYHSPFIDFRVAPGDWVFNETSGWMEYSKEYFCVCPSQKTNWTFPWKQYYSLY